MDLTIVIPTFNNFKQLVDCLLTLTYYNEYPFKLVIVNNGDSVDADGRDFEEALRQFIYYPHLKVINTGQNLGWQKSVNLAFEQECDTRLFGMFNDDLVFLPHQTTFLRQLCYYFKFDEIGAVGPSSNYAFSAQNLWRHGLPRIFTSTILIGFCMILRSDLFSKIGGLDDGLVGGDDLDLSILIRKHGFKLMVDRSCYVHHIGCQTGGRVVGQYWNSQDHIENTNNALIKKHGVRWWWETTQALVSVFEPLTVTEDSEGDVIREWVGDLPIGIDVGVGHNKTVARSVGVDKTAKGVYGVAGGRKFDKSIADVCAESHDMPMFDENSQDFIVCRHVFEHILDPVPTLKEFMRVLKPGGKLVLACPNQESMPTLLIDWSHLHGYTPSSVTSLLEITGFRVTRVETLKVSLSHAFVIEAIKPDADIYGEQYSVQQSVDRTCTDGLLDAALL